MSALLVEVVELVDAPGPEPALLVPSVLADPPDPLPEPVGVVPPVPPEVSSSPTVSSTVATVPSKPATS
ncbi:MAG: hypothetical protein R2711_16240 [Acidimicrobiales bacterium]